MRYEIPLPEAWLGKPVFVGEKSRTSTSTSVVLLSPNTLACCHFDGCVMFLLRFDLERRQFETIQTIPTLFGGKPAETDLMATDGAGRLATTNLYSHSCTMYQVVGDSVEFLHDVSYDAGGMVHGLKFYDASTIAITTRGKESGIHFVDISSHQCRYRISMPNQSAQDLVFLSPNKMAVAVTYGHPQLDSFAIYDAAVYLIEFDIHSGHCEIVKQRDFKSTHFDNIVFNDGKVFMTDQYNNRVVVLNADTLDFVGSIEGFNFPHGIDVNHGLMAVSNYGNNTMTLFKLEDLTG